MKKKKEPEFKVGQRFKVGETYIKVMAFADGYIMARYKGCIPFCETLKAFNYRLYQLTPTSSLLPSKW